VKCLVSGATGFVGQQLCQQLLHRGDSLVALSRSGDALENGTPTLAMDLAVNEPDHALLRGVDVVVHLAGIAHTQAAESDYQQLNYHGALRLARRAAAAGVGCFIFLSSVKAMGRCRSGARRAEHDCALPEDPYGLSKWRAECALREEFDQADMSVVILRPALVYGPQAKGNLRLLARGVRLGLPRPPDEGLRSMIAVGDLVSLACIIASDPPAGVATWIACDNRRYSTRLFYDLLREANGRGRGYAWLPRWGWRLAATLLDLLPGRHTEPTFNKLFGTELYSNAAVLAATRWQPRGDLEAVVAAMLVADGGGHK